jgi:hypothetical protein
VPGKPGKVAGKVIVKIVNGKVYVNGKLVPKSELRPCPPLPPLPDKGKGIVCVIDKGPGKPGTLPGKPGVPAKPGKVTVKVVNGKVYVNGKLVPDAKPLPKDKQPKCPPPPPHGKGDGKDNGKGKGKGKWHGDPVLVLPGTGAVVTKGGAPEAGLTFTTAG